VTAISAWVIGIAAAKFIPGIAPINSVIFTMGAYYVGTKVMETKRRSEAC